MGSVSVEEDMAFKERWGKIDNPLDAREPEQQEDEKES